MGQANLIKRDVKGWCCMTAVVFISLLTWPKMLKCFERPFWTLRRFRYSFAIVGINLTHMAYKLLADGSAKSHIYNVATAASEIGDGNIRWVSLWELYSREGFALYRNCWVCAKWLLHSTVTLLFQYWNKNGDEVSPTTVECSNHFAHTQQFLCSDNPLLPSPIAELVSNLTIFDGNSRWDSNEDGLVAV